MSARSGEHAAVKAYRRKLESIKDSTLEELHDLNRKLDEQIENCPARKDPRRDGDSDPPVDRVELRAPTAPKRKP